MKKLFYLMIVFFSLNSFNALSQELHNYADLQLESDGTVYVSETDSVSGRIFFNALTNGLVTLTVPDGKKTIYRSKEILGFKTLNPKKSFTTLRSDGIDKSFLLYENITPYDGKKLLLVKSFQAQALNKVVVVNETVDGKWEVCMYHTAQWKVLGTGLKKISEAVKDCSELSQKISNKEKGYTYGFIAPPLVMEEVFTNIVIEYNSCN